MASQISPMPYYFNRPVRASGPLKSLYSESNSWFRRIFAACRYGQYRQRNRCLVFVTSLFFLVICYSSFVFLPDELPKVSGFGKLFEKVVNKIPDSSSYVIPKPDIYANESLPPVGDHVHWLARDNDPHVKRDREKFRKKINEDRQPIEPAHQIPLPKTIDEQQKLGIEAIEKKTQVDDESALHSDMLDAENERRRLFIKNMTIFAWNNYKKYAWGANELKPISAKPHHSSVFGNNYLGATIVDALDTLYVMGLLEEYSHARDWVEKSFNFLDVVNDLSVFETTIRFIGGFLAAFALTGDKMFKEKAILVADRLLPAFNTPTGIPYALINVHSKNYRNYDWAPGKCSILSEFGTLSLEFEYLSVVTGNDIYANKTRRIRNVLSEIEKPDDLYRNYLHPRTKDWCSDHVSIGALGDSFYEYLLKSWLITNKRDYQGLQMYEKAMEGLRHKLFQDSFDKLFYIAELKPTGLYHKVDHLACFAGGMFALHSNNIQNQSAKEYWLQKAEQLATTCHTSYKNTDTGLGPESFRFYDTESAVTHKDGEMYYILRPEVVEAWFYLWRITKDQKYRDWTWEAVQAIEKYCKATYGYSGIKNVYNKNSPKDDVQQSFFLAETLKYLYLTFSPDDVIPLNKWVFNTEGHPLPIRFKDSDHAPAVLSRNVPSVD